MGTPISPLKLAINDKIKDQFIIRKKLGEGSCGTVFLVQNLKEPKIRAAMKVEPFMKCKDDEILKMEVFVLKRMQSSKHVCRLLMAGKISNFSFMVMSLLGKELSDIRRRLPDRKMSVASVLKIGIQCCQAVHDMHMVGFVHRDVKPTNFCVGAQHRNMIYIFDFGLARQILLPENGGSLTLREPRSKVSFRGTVRYCSINVHEYKEQGRHDDLWSVLYMLIELLTGTLPWKGLSRRESGQIKANVTDATLTSKCPVSFAELNTMLKKLTYFDKPNYEAIKDSFKRDLKETKVKLTDPFEWDVMKEDRKSSAEKTDDKDEKAEIDKMEGTDTHRDVGDSADSADTDEPSQTKGFAKEDTLENVTNSIQFNQSDMKK
ncbi:hypothetical protein QR680_014015 [Steinernema hermaphroditum]|uniref:non-specific serine/threonine protein kinase n=1 Tax=Steinernema hermaphroditum TaxID=289476 RepID=A0AA39M3B9_9BILA|nr:hypothetical protein QR680_014015 [Steinernema hermaphroditum]